jgi:hypothetical protein
MQHVVRKLSLLLCLYGLFTLSLLAQRGADPSVRYYRLICLVHMVGSGKANDPVRPEYVPTAADAKRQGILAWSFQLTDDKGMAIIHVVASNRAAFAPILADKRPEVKIFEIGKDAPAAIEAAMQLVKAGFSLSKFQVVAQ